MKPIIVLSLVVLGLTAGLFFNGLWMYNLIIEIVDAFRAVQPIASSDIAWLILKLLFRGVVFALTITACLIPAGLANMFLKD